MMKFRRENKNMELVYIYSIMSLLALVGIIWLQIKMRKDKRGIL